MAVAIHHHQNDDLWRLGACLVASALVLSGAIALLHVPAVQAFLDNSASLIWQQVQGTFRVPRP